MSIYGNKLAKSAVAVRDIFTRTTAGLAIRDILTLGFVAAIDNLVLALGTSRDALLHLLQNFNFIKNGYDWENPSSGTGQYWLAGYGTHSVLEVDGFDGAAQKVVYVDNEGAELFQYFDTEMPGIAFRFRIKYLCTGNGTFEVKTTSGTSMFNLPVKDRVVTADVEFISPDHFTGILFTLIGGTADDYFVIDEVQLYIDIAYNIDKLNFDYLTTPPEPEDPEGLYTIDGNPLYDAEGNKLYAEEEV